MIEVNLLRYALAAADSGSFSRAAEQFRVKQSTLSKRIRYLELRLGVPLFTRSTQGVAPTPSGMRFLARARAIVVDLDLLSMESVALARGERGRLRIGFHGTLAAGDLRATLEDFRREAPEVEVDAVEGGRDRLLESLDRGVLDVAVIAGDAQAARCRSLCLWSEALIVGLHPRHALIDSDRVYWTDLRGTNFLVTSADPGDLIAGIIAARLTGSGHAPRIIIQSVSRDNLHSLATPDRLSVIMGAAPKDEVGMAFREVHDAFGPTRIDQCLHWRDDNDNPVLSLLLATAARRYGRRLPLTADSIS